MECKLFGFFLIFCLLVSPAVYGEEGPHVEIFTPQRMAKVVRQVSVRFSEPMVPIGDPRGLIEPFEMDCSEKGTGQWAWSQTPPFVDGSIQATHE